MGLIMKKDDSEDKDLIDGIEVIGRGEGPDGLDLDGVDIVDGATAQDISGTTARRIGVAETEADPELAGFSHFAPSDGGSGDGGDTQPPSGPAGGGSFFAKYGKLCMAAALVAVIAAGIIGYFVGSGGFGTKGASSAVLTEDQLDVAVASWSYKGSTNVVTAREVIESQQGLEAAAGEDGTYAAPSADMLISYVRNKVLEQEAEARGAVPTEDEVLAYAEQTLGTSDFDALAEQYGIGADQAKAVVEQQAKIMKLYDTIVTDAPTVPEAPAEPKQGEEDTATEAYAEYILGLAGSEWDAEKKQWATADGMFATAFAGSDFDGTTATYEQAQMAFYVAYQMYATESSESTAAWNTFVNDLFANVDLSLYGILA